MHASPKSWGYALSHKNVASYSSSNINLGLSSSRGTKGHSSIFMLSSSPVPINWCVLVTVILLLLTISIQYKLTLLILLFIHHL
jgi:hypothetical protein